MIKTKHIFQLSRIVDKMELADDIKDLVSDAKGKDGKGADESALRLQDCHGNRQEAPYGRD